MMRETEDGFRIAEEDLRLRGAGEVLGTRQSGLAGLPPRPHRASTATSWRRPATTPGSSSSATRGSKASAAQALRLLLYLFERDAAVRLLRAG